MFQRKLIAVLSVIALLALTAGTGYASLSRVEGMALSGEGLQTLTEDYVNIYTFPSSVVRQNNLVFAELGSNPGGFVNSVNVTDRSFTLVRNFPKLGVVSVQMKQSADNLYNASDNVNHEWFDLIWGRASSKADYAIRLDVSNSYYEDEFNFGTAGAYKARGWDSSFDPYPFGAFFFSDAIVATGVELNTYGITPGVSLHMENDNRLDLAATYRRYSLNRAVSGPFFGAAPEKWEDGGNASYAVMARYLMNRGDASQWYISGGYMNDDLSWKVTNVTATPREADETYKGYGIGIANNMRVNDNNLLIWGFAASQMKHSYERTDNNDAVLSGDTKSLTEKSTTAPVLFAALETKATSWWTFRVGANNAITHSNEEFTDFDSPAGTEKIRERFTDFRLAIGSGLRFNNLDVDFTINDQFPLSMGYIASGNNRTPFDRVSVTYHF